MSRPGYSAGEQLPSRFRPNNNSGNGIDEKESYFKTDDTDNEYDASETTPIINTAFKDVPEKNSQMFLYLLTFFSALGGLLFGYDTGVISGAMLPLERLFNLDDIWRELIVSITVGTAIIGAVTGGWFNDKFGRRLVLIMASLVFTVGAVVMACAKNKETLLVGRAIVGVAIGYASTTVPMYIAEAAPAAIRGKLITMYQMSITFGQFFASVMDGFFSHDKENGWRYMLGIGGVPAVIMLVGMIFMPESPRYLVNKGKVLQAELVLKKVRGGADVKKELAGFINSCQKDSETETTNAFATLKRVLKTSYTRRALVVGCGLQAIQQLCGINTVMYYSATILKLAGVQDEQTAIWLAAVVAGSNFLFTFIALFLVERISRLKITLSSLFGVTVALCLLSATFFILKSESPKTMIKYNADKCSNYSTCYTCLKDDSCGFCYTNPKPNHFTNGACLQFQSKDVRPQFCNATNSLWTHDHDACPTSYAWLAVLSMILYLAAFGQGMGPMPWTINAEIYPLWARGTGTACSTATNWFFNLLISITFLNLIKLVSRAGAFLVYASFAAIGWIFLFLLLPETKGKTLEDIEDLFKGNVIVRCRKK